MLSSQYVNQLTEFQKAINVVKSSGIQEALNFVNDPVIQQMCQSASMVQNMTASMKIVAEWNSMLASARNALRGAFSENVLEQYRQMIQPISESVQLIRYFHEYEHLITSFQPLDGILNNYNSDDSSDMESTENEEINNKIVTELFQPDSVKVIDNEESPIITLSPVNDQVLKYLSEYPESFY